MCLTHRPGHCVHPPARRPRSPLPTDSAHPALQTKRRLPLARSTARLEPPDPALGRLSATPGLHARELAQNSLLSIPSRRGQESRAPPRPLLLRPVRRESATARKFARLHSGAVATPPRGETEAAPPPAQRAPWASLPLRGKETVTWKSCAPSSENFSRYTRSGSAGSGAREAGSRGAAGRRSLRGRRAPVLLPASCPRSLRAVAAAAEAGRRSPGWPREEGTLKGARSPLAPASEAGRRGAEGERDLERRGASSALRAPQERRGGR